MAKSYLKYEQELTFGIVSSCNNVQWHALQPVALTAAGERLIAWNVKAQTQVFVLGGQAETAVTAFDALPTLDLVVAGHSDGCVRVWKREDSELLCVLEGHSSSVLSVALGLEGALAVTGGADTDIIVWDLVSHTGLFKLRGHTDQVTRVAFIDDCARIVSCSKDGSLKVWDVGQQRCVQTLPGHRGEVWSFDCSDRWMVSGGKDADLRVWQRVTSSEDSAALASEDVFEFFGTVTRASANERVAHIKFNDAGSVLMCQTADRCVQLLLLRSAEEAKDKRQRRQKRQREKEREKAIASKGSGETKIDTETLQQQASDWFSSGVLLTCAGNVKCTDIRGGTVSDTSKLQGVQVLVARSNGSIEVHEADEDGSVLKQLYAMSIPANGSDVRCLEFSTDQRSILSCSGSELKVWSATSGACTATISTGPAVAATWLPGDRYAVAGMKSGGLRVVDVSTCDVVQEIDAHAGTCWSISMDKKNNRFVTGGSDKKIRFWQICPSSPQQLVTAADVIEVADAVLSVRYSPKMKFLAACLLDCTVRIYHADTMTFFLSLYGHRLPVLCCSMSSDETVIVTGSADKNVKIWGLDFGDCQKSMFAHGDSVMAVQFVPNTHYFFSSGKDGVVKFWDADIRECVMTFNHHHAEVLALAVSRDGETMCSGGRDRSIRVYVRGDEQVFLEEQRQLALEKELDAQEMKGFEAGAVMGDAKQIESARVSRLTKDTIEASERLVEMIELLDHEDSRKLEHAAAVASALAQGIRAPEFTENPFLLGLSHSGYVNRILRSIRPNDMEQSVLLLNHDCVMKLLQRLHVAMSQMSDVELCTRAALLLLKHHQNKLENTISASSVLDSLRVCTKSRIRQRRNVIGVNSAALSAILDLVKSSQVEAEMFDEAREGAAEAASAKAKKKAKDDEEFIALRLPKGKAVSKGKRPTAPRDGDAAATKKSKQK